MFAADFFTFTNLISESRQRRHEMVTDMLWICVWI